jgi:hypothetical protein
VDQLTWINYSIAWRNDKFAERSFSLFDWQIESTAIFGIWFQSAARLPSAGDMLLGVRCSSLAYLKNSSYKPATFNKEASIVVLSLPIQRSGNTSSTSSLADMF